MTTQLQDRIDKRAQAWHAMVEIMERTGQNPSGEDQQAYARAEAQYDSEDAVIAQAEKFLKLAAANSAVDRKGVVAAAEDITDEEDARYERVFNSFIRNGQSNLEREDRQLLASKFTSPQNAAGTTTTAGGYTIPPAFRDAIIQQLKYFGPMVQEAELLETSGGQNIPWPTNDDTGNVGAILAENTAVTEQDVTLGTNSLDSYMYTSKLVRVSYQLMQDNPKFDAWLAKRLGERIGRILNQHFTTGTGTAQPDGIVTNATVGATTSSTFALTGGVNFAALVDLIESLDPAYGGLSDLKFMGHQTARKAVRKILDSQNRPLWEPSLQAGVPSNLMGYEFVLNNDMATEAIGSKSLGFGSIREAYVVRIVQDMKMMRLDERYADFLQVGFLAFERADGTLQNASAWKVLQGPAS
ncbi:MAG TPA: phage major capsid protein [Umezawaea sp.]|nr:phage major capsid protein [Umezawaea sp.]